MRCSLLFGAFALLALVLPGAGHAAPSGGTSYTATGRASYYGARHDGRRTADGSRFDPSAFTGAHRTLPFGTKVRVTNLANGRTVLVRITDRGPRHPGRLIDVSASAARELGMQRRGIARVRIRAVADDRE